MVTTRTQHEIRVAVLALLGVQLVTAIGTVVLLTRTGTAVEQILAENDYSLEAVEAMQHVLAGRAVGAVTAAERDRFGAALGRAESNLTEADERAPLVALRSHHEGALDGDRAHLGPTLTALGTLADVNRASMERADRRAHRLSQGGAWAAVCLTIATMGLSIVLIRRANRRLIEPIGEMYLVARGFQRGDPLRRCTTVDMPLELSTVGSTLNELLDAHATRDAMGRLAGTRAPQTQGPPSDRLVLLAMLDAVPHGAAIVHKGGEVIATNRAGMDALDRAGRRLTELVERPVEGGPRVTRLSDDFVRLDFAATDGGGPTKG